MYPMIIGVQLSDINVMCLLCFLVEGYIFHISVVGHCVHNTHKRSFVHAVLWSRNRFQEHFANTVEHFHPKSAAARFISAV